MNKPVRTLEIDEALLDEAAALGVDPRSAAEGGLAAALKAERERRWREENAEAIEAHNRLVEEHGIPLARYRQF
ncbi:MAG: type II toxin-antitoxin system CcdA family antitoxin [Shimia sp.]